MVATKEGKAAVQVHPVVARNRLHRRVRHRRVIKGHRRARLRLRVVAVLAQAAVKAKQAIRPSLLAALRQAVARSNPRQAVAHSNVTQ